MSGEKLYDEVLAPKLLEIAALCRDAGLQFVAVVEYEQGSVGITEQSELAAAGPQFRLAAYGARCRGNIDSLITAVVKDDKKHVPEGGHTNSFYIKQLERIHG